MFCLRPRFRSDSDKTPGSAATRGSSHAVRPLPLPNFLCSFVVARKRLEDSRDVLAVVQKTALAVLRRLVAKGVVRRQALADGTHVWERG